MDKRKFGLERGVERPLVQAEAAEPIFVRRLRSWHFREFLRLPLQVW